MSCIMITWWGMVVSYLTHGQLQESEWPVPEGKSRLEKSFITVEGWRRRNSVVTYMKCCFCAKTVGSKRFTAFRAQNNERRPSQTARNVYNVYEGWCGENGKFLKLSLNACFARLCKIQWKMGNDREEMAIEGYIVCVSLEHA